MQDLEQLIQHCRQGNALAWERVVREFQPRVYGLAHYFMRSNAEAQDCTQDAFIKMYKGLENFQGSTEEFVPWILTITRNCCLDRLRGSKRKDKGQQSYREEIEVNHPVAESPEDSLDREQNRSISRAEIYSVLDQFNEESREIILLKDIQGLKNETVAQMLDISIGTVKSRSSRARTKLAKALLAMRSAEWPEQVR